MNKIGKLIFGLFALIGLALAAAGIYSFIFGGAFSNHGQNQNGAIILFAMGVVFLLFGAAPLLYYTLKTSRQRKLIENGVPLPTQFNRVELNRSISINGQSPYIIISHWKDPVAKNNIWEFKSANMWFDPEPYIQTDKPVMVYVNPDNYKQYAMDMSQFPTIK